jgi:biopolymer transport protein ExbD
MIVGLLGAVGCGNTVYQPADLTRLELAPLGATTFRDIQQAFAARPQLPAQFRVAFFTFGGRHTAVLDAMLRTVPGVTETFHIPARLVGGRRFFSDSTAPSKQTGPPVSMRQLRLVAARGHAELLVVFDYGYRIEYSPNGLAALGIALAPLLVLPYRDVKTISYLDGYVVAAASGYLYGRLSVERRDTDDYLTLYSRRGRQLVNAQFGSLVVEMGQQLQQLMALQHVAVAVNHPHAPSSQGPLGAPETPELTDTQDPWARTELVLNFGPSGELFINGFKMNTDEQAATRLDQLARGRECTVRVRAHGAVSRQRLVEVLNLLKAARIDRVSIEPGPLLSSPTAVPDSSPTRSRMPATLPRGPAPADPWRLR